MLKRLWLLLTKPLAGELNGVTDEHGMLAFDDDGALLALPNKRYAIYIIEVGDAETVVL